MTHQTVHPKPSDEAARRHLVGGEHTAQPGRVAPNFLDGDEPSTTPAAAESTQPDEANDRATVENPMPLAPSCLGLTLGMREVGYAVANPEHLAAFGILNIGKLQTPESKESRFRTLVLNYLDHPQVTRIALVEPYPGIADEALVTSLIAWLNQVTVEQQRPIDVVTYQAVMRSFGTDAQPATQRTLCTTLAKRFPVLSRFTPEAELPARGFSVPDTFAQKLPRFASPRERYWQRAFLALASSLHASAQAATSLADQHAA